MDQQQQIQDLEAKLLEIRQMATTSTPNCINLDGIDRILGSELKTKLLSPPNAGSFGLPYGQELEAPQAPFERRSFLANPEVLVKERELADMRDFLALEGPIEKVEDVLKGGPYKAMAYRLLQTLEHFYEKGIPGVLHEIDQSFYDLAIKERDNAQALNRVYKAETQAKLSDPATMVTWCLRYLTNEGRLYVWDKLGRRLPKISLGVVSDATIEQLEALRYDVACKLTSMEESERIILEYMRSEEVCAALGVTLKTIAKLLADRQSETSTMLVTGQRQGIPPKEKEAISIANALRHELKFIKEDLLTATQREKLKAWVNKHIVLKQLVHAAWLPGIPTLAKGEYHEFRVKVGNGQYRKLWWMQEASLDSQGEEIIALGWYTTRTAFGYKNFFEPYQGKVLAYQVELI